MAAPTSSHEEPQELVATLFHRPQQPLPAADASYITPSIVSSFVSTVQAIHGRRSDSLRYTDRALDSLTHPHIVSVTFVPDKPLSELRRHADIAAFERAHHIEVIFQPSSTLQTNKRLAVFDMDSTLIQQEVIELLASQVGVEEQVADITSRAMNGELDFADSLRERVALLKGLRANVFDDLKPRVTLTPGADTLIRCLRALGVKTALLSGGFTPLAQWVGDRLGMDHVHANDLASEGEGGKETLTGELDPGTVIVDSARKRELVLKIADEEGIADRAAIMAVGDGANDLPMLWEAGLGVAVNAKPRVQEQAPARLNGETALLDVLHLLGLTAEDIDRLAGE